jgi:hypothetical protein
VPLVSSKVFTDRQAAKSFRNLSASGPFGTSPATGPMVDNGAHDPSVNDLEQRLYSWVVPATAHSARLFGDVRSTAPNPTVFTWMLRLGAWGAVNPGWHPGGTILLAGVSALNTGDFPLVRFGGLVIPVTPLGDLQLCLEHSEGPADGDPLVGGLSLATLGATSPIEDFRIDFRTEFAGGSGSAFGVGDHGEPGGGVW